MCSIALLLGILFEATTVRQGDFVLSATMLSALEGGPHVVQVTLTYIGNQPVVARLSTIPDVNVQLTSLSPSFLMYSVQSIISDSSFLPEDVLISKGKCITERYYLHHLSQQYPSAGIPFVAKSAFKYWRTEDGKPKGESVAFELQKKLILTRAKPTPARVAEIRTKLIDRLHQSFGDEGEGWHECSQWLRNTHYAEFCPIAIRMFDATRFDDREWFSFAYLLNCTGSIDASNRLLISELKKPGLASANVFVAWRHPKFRLPSKVEIESLLDAPNLWVRALTASSFPMFLRNEHCKVVFAQVRSRLDPEPSREFVAILARLDDPSFQVREDSSKRLASMGERTEAMILRVLAKPPSLEVEIRLKRALKDMQVFEPVPESFRVIHALERLTTQEAKELLNIVADGPVGLRSAHEAKKAIERIKEAAAWQRKLEGKEKK